VVTRINEVQKWINEHPDDVKIFRDAYENKSMSNGEIAQMFGFTTYPKKTVNGDIETVSAPYVSIVARQLGLKPKHATSSNGKPQENSFSKVERLKRELAEAQKEQMREAQSDEAKIRKFVDSMGGIANFQLKMRIIRW
jgi:hypothetical protein